MSSISPTGSEELPLVIKKNKMGKKVRRGNYKKFINQNSVVKTANLITSLEFPAFPEEIYLKRFKY